MQADSSSRAERLAAALRENLKRRKARSRALETPPNGPARDKPSPKDHPEDAAKPA
jgi:hypothetical protein